MAQAAVQWGRGQLPVAPGRPAATGRADSDSARGARPPPAAGPAGAAECPLPAFLRASSSSLARQPRRRLQVSIAPSAENAACWWLWPQKKGNWRPISAGVPAGPAGLGALTRSAAAVLFDNLGYCHFGPRPTSGTQEAERMEPGAERGPVSESFTETAGGSGLRNSALAM